MREIYEDSIILIGPSGAGKSTVAEELKKKLGMERVFLDKLANAARKNGVRAQIEEEAIQQGKNPKDAFGLAMICSLIEMAKEHQKPGIVDFGAGHAVFETREGLKEAKKLLKPFQNIVLLLPCKEEEKAIQILKERSTGDFRDNEAFLKNPSYCALATMTVYTEGKTPQEIASIIIEEIAQKKKMEQTTKEIDGMYNFSNTKER